MSLVRRWQPAIYASEQVCIGWHRTGACYTDKLTFSHGSSVKVWGAYYINVRIIFEVLRYIRIGMVVPWRHDYGVGLFWSLIAVWFILMWHLFIHFLYMDIVLSLVIAFYFATVMASYSILGFYPSKPVSLIYRDHSYLHLTELHITNVTKLWIFAVLDVQLRHL